MLRVACDRKVWAGCPCCMGTYTVNRHAQAHTTFTMTCAGYVHQPALSRFPVCMTCPPLQEGWLQHVHPPPPPPPGLAGLQPTSPGTPLHPPQAPCATPISARASDPLLPE